MSEIAEAVRSLVFSKSATGEEFVPWRRAQNVTTATAGGATVGTSVSPLQEKLRRYNGIVGAGAQVIQLSDEHQIPSIATGAVVQFVTETGTVTATDATLTALALTPHRAGATFTVTHQLLTQSPNVETAIERELESALDFAITLNALSGTGVSGEILGLVNRQTDTFTFGAAPTNGDCAAIIRKLTDNLAFDPASVAFFASPATREKFQDTERFAGSGSPLWADDSTILGVRAISTPCVLNSTSQLILGSWSRAIVAAWGGVKIVKDQFARKKTGEIELYAEFLLDVGFIDADKAFIVSTNAAL